MPASRQKKTRAQQIADRLAKSYREAWCALEYKQPLELLVATILSAQCTDQRVNLVTRQLFRKYQTAEDYSRAPIVELEKEIQSTGFFRNKAKNIQAACQELTNRYEGQVPRRMEDLVQLPGVGRKTANVVLGTAFGIASGVVVDTHVGRVSRRLGLTKEEDPEKVERDLMALLPQDQWIAFSHRVIQHGRQICTARLAKCDICPLLDLCDRVGIKGKTTLPVEKPKVSDQFKARQGK